MKILKNILISICNFNNLKSMFLFVIIVMLVSNDSMLCSGLIAGVSYILIAIILSALIEFYSIYKKNKK